MTAAPYSFPVPPLRLLAAAGVVTGIGHDGIRDLWGPYGTGDLLERARHVAYRSGFRRDDDIELVLRAATTGGRELLTGDRRGVEPGAVADLVVVPADQRRGGGGAGAAAARGRQAGRGQSGSRSARASTSAAGAVSRHASKVSSASSSRSMPSR